MHAESGRPSASPNLTDGHYQPFIEHLQAGGTIICAHDRLARHLRRRYAEVQALSAHGGTQAWATPRVFTERQFLQQAYERAALAAPPDRPLPFLLSDRQAVLVWADVIQQVRLANARDESGAVEPLLAARGAAEKARQARRTLLELQQPVWTEGRHYNADPEAFRQYLAAFEKRLAAQNWIERADLPGLLIRLLTDGDFPPDGLPQVGNYLFVGFTEDWPQRRALAKALGGEFHPDPATTPQWPPPHSDSVRAIRVSDYDTETDQACLWAVQRLQAWLNDSNRDPVSPRIGIAVLNPRTRVVRFQRVLHHLLDAEGLGLASDQTDYDPRRHAFSVQNPTPLLFQPLVSTALDILSLDPHQVSSRRLLELLRSPFHRMAGRQRFQLMNSDTVIRCDWPPIIGLNEALERLNQSGLGHSAKILRELLSLEAYKPDPRPFADWARHWAAVLAKTGWPRAKGERLDSASFQVAERFQQVLAEVGTLDLVTPQMPDRERALSHLEGMLRSTLFQLEGPFGPIEVFDVAESAGLEFDALFLCGFVDEAWPPVPQSSHFIPAEQLIPPSLGGLAKVECPRATARNTRDYAKRITSMLFRSAPEVVIGLPEADGAGRVLRPSMLLPDSVIAHAQAAPASGCPNPWATAVQKIRDSLQGHITEQPELPLPVTPEEAQRITGGAYLLQAQSLCPVQAFLRYRMQLDPVEPEVLGLRSLEIGTIMHRVLELFWKDLPAYLQQGPSAKANHALLQSVLTTEVDGKKQQAIALNDQGRNFVKQCVESALMEPSIKARLCFLPEEYAQVLQAEILNLVEKWLCLEFAHPFDQIEGLELQENYQIKDLTLRLRVDRVQISDDEQVLIDYKGSKKFPSKAWLGMRPEEPQLPLYALILKRNNRPVGEIAFGVYGNEPCYVSMSRQKVLAKVPTSPTLVAELIGSGMLNDQEYLKKLLGVRGSEISQEALFKAVLDSYDSIIPRLLESFLAGSPILDPLVRRAHSPVPEVRNLACSTCAYQDVCRIREYLGHGSADDEDGEEEEPAE